MSKPRLEHIRRDMDEWLVLDGEVILHRVYYSVSVKDLTEALGMKYKFTDLRKAELNLDVMTERDREKVGKLLEKFKRASYDLSLPGVARA